MNTISTQDDQVKILQDAIHKVEKHLERMQESLEIVGSLFPLTPEVMEKLTKQQKTELEILIYRFTHLQDALSGKIFPLFLDVVGEQTAKLLFIDKLNLLERLDIIADMYQWKDIRDLRNHFAHDYTNDFELQAKYLNSLYQYLPVLTSTFNRIKERLAQSGMLK